VAVPRKTILQIRGLSVTYSPEAANVVNALDAVHLEIRGGEVLGILGESGCGKTTLAHSLLGLLPTSARVASGEILFHGRDLLGLPESELRAIRGREISKIPQDPALSLNPVLTVGSQVAEVLRAHLSLTARERRDSVCELLREVGFDQPETIYDTYPHQLSGGQRQRIVIAQAVACRPTLLIADEPTSKLDGPLRSEISALFLKLRQQYGTTILFISHDPAVLATFADRIALMYAGNIVELGDSAEVCMRPLHPYTQALLGLARSSLATGAIVKGRFPKIQGTPPDPANLPVGCRFEPRCSDRMQVCALRCPAEFVPEPERSVNCFKYGE
jgi:oligopeptide/dipeptide ABC transporter ATP-binding protein